MSQGYEKEQREIAERIDELESEIDKVNSNSFITDHFIAKVRKYTRAKKLSGLDAKRSD